MIQEVDDALRTIVRRDALRGGDVDVAFDAPTREWSSRRNAPTVDLYLYDIREDLQRREVMWQAIRDQETGFVAEHRPPPRYYKLSYLVTAWTQRPEDEHRLLSAVLSCFIRHERLPDDVLTGALVGDLPIFATIALPPPSDRPLSDIWSALGGELKPSLDLVIVAPLVDGREEVAGPPVREEPRIGLRRPRPGAAGTNGAAGAEHAGGEEAAEEVAEGGGGPAGGRRRRGAGAAGAAAEAGAPSATGTGGQAGAAGQGQGQGQGEGKGEAGAAGQAGARPATPGAAPGSAAAGTGPGSAQPLPDETVRSGSEAHPGRIVRVHVRRPPR
jgi:Pvc16 N-terminal domain